MERLAFKMMLKPGNEAEYKRRHDEIWPELEQLLKENGIENYSIFLDINTLCLFGVLNIKDQKKIESLPSYPIMQKWWAYMADIMEVNDDNSPKSVQLKDVFYLK